MKSCFEMELPTGRRALYPRAMRTFRLFLTAGLVAFGGASALDGRSQSPDRAFLTSELIFPLEHWHNHASTIVELPGGDLLACWFHGSGERTADDVGRWALIYNDLERGRYRLAVSLSEDEGRTWRWTRHLERDPDSTDETQLGQYHYPSIIQAADGTLHATYSFFAPAASVTADAEKRLPRKAIKHAHFNEAWIRNRQ